jgi:uncharacterized protein YukE
MSVDRFEKPARVIVIRREDDSREYAQAISSAIQLLTVEIENATAAFDRTGKQAFQDDVRQHMRERSHLHDLLMAVSS